MNILEFENNMDYIREQAIELLNGVYSKEDSDEILKKIVDLADYKFIDLIEEWEACDKMKIFEVEVEDVRTKEIEYLTFDICLNVKERTFEAQHVALNQKQAESDYISYASVDIDANFDLDYHLQALYDECTQAICNSKFYRLRG